MPQSRIVEKTANAILPAAEHQADERSQEASPQLADYRDKANDPALLLELARQLETQGNPQQSLLAWERLIDSAAPDDARTAEAIQSIKRLRPALPAWNTDPSKTIAITLHAGTSRSSAQTITPALDEIVRDLELASSGILKITPVITAGNDIPQSRGPARIALWLAGSRAEACSTGVIVLTVGPAGNIRDEVLKSLLQIIRSQLARSASLVVPAAANAAESPLESITRLGWLELGSGLNKTLE
jgi:hypothetical protein